VKLLYPQDHRVIDLAPQLQIQSARLFDLILADYHSGPRCEFLPVFAGEHVSAVVRRACLQINRKESSRIHLEHGGEAFDGIRRG